MIMNLLKRIFSTRKEEETVHYRIPEVENTDSDEESQRKAGVRGYIWRTVGDERVCDRCRSLEGKKIQWNKRPNGGHPGECLTCNDGKCRCYAEPDWSTSPFNID